MLTDPLTEKIRSIRRELASRFDNDVSRILSDVRQREALDERLYVRLPKRPVRAEMLEQRHTIGSQDSARKECR
jgi:hypothetical protein